MDSDNVGGRKKSKSFLLKGATMNYVDDLLLKELPSFDLLRSGKGYQNKGVEILLSFLAFSQRK